MSKALPRPRTDCSTLIDEFHQRLGEAAGLSVDGLWMSVECPSQQLRGWRQAPPASAEGVVSLSREWLEDTADGSQMEIADVVIDASMPRWLSNFSQAHNSTGWRNA